MRRVKTGIAGLDEILQGGLWEAGSYLVEGAPGTGKTTLGMQFIYYGITLFNEPGIIITFEEFPEQIYHDALGFGWDLRDLEKQGKMRVLCTSPETLAEEILHPGGLVDELVREVGAKRILVDSITLFEQLGKPAQVRQLVYTFRNALKRLGLTSLLTKELSQETETGLIPFEEYLFDGVIRLHFHRLKGDYRERYLEVTKLRGSDFVNGKHLFRYSPEGIRILNNLTHLVLNSDGCREKVPTGIARLDQFLGGGIPRGATFVLDTNSKANYTQLLGSIIAEHVRQGDGALLIPCSLMSFADLQAVLAWFEVDLVSLAQEGRAMLFDYYARPLPPELEPYVVNVKDMDTASYKKLVQQSFVSRVLEDRQQGRKWFIYADFNTAYVARGESYIREIFSEMSAFARMTGINYLVLCNFSEMSPQKGSFIERTACGVLRTWVEGKYQFLQVTKSPNGRVSEPLVVQYTGSRPFLELV